MEIACREYKKGCKNYGKSHSLCVQVSNLMHNSVFISEQLFALANTKMVLSRYPNI